MNEQECIFCFYNVMAKQARIQNCKPFQRFEANTQLTLWGTAFTKLIPKSFLPTPRSASLAMMHPCAIVVLFLLFPALFLGIPWMEGPAAMRERYLKRMIGLVQIAVREHAPLMEHHEHVRSSFPRLAFNCGSLAVEFRSRKSLRTITVLGSAEKPNSLPGKRAWEHTTIFTYPFPQVIGGLEGDADILSHCPE